MKILSGLDGLRSLPHRTVMSIGNFDGVHRGHAHILETARRLSATTRAGVSVVTFEPHPLTVLRPERAPRRLTTRPLKHALLERSGADYLVELPPTPQVLDLTAEQFWQILRDDVQPAHLVEGNSFYFGKGRAGSLEKLRQWSVGSAVEIHVVASFSVALLNLSIVTASSSLIRWLLANGRARDAAICLGRPYELSGEVVTGHQRGRTFGVPTANLKIVEQVVPADGVYSGRSIVNGTAYPAAVSIGTLPTFNDSQRQIEVHLIGFEGDLYGQVLTVEVTDWLREQRKYADVASLLAQIREDLQATEGRVSLRPQEAIGMTTQM